MDLCDEDWFVVIAEIEDGHDNNKYFFTNDENLFRNYAACCLPYELCRSGYMTEFEAKIFVKKNLEGDIQIDPRDFIFSLCDQVAAGFLTR